MDIIINNLKIRYFVKGEGENLVLLHGWGGSSKSLSTLQDLLSGKGYKVYSIDLPGFGQSDRPPKDWSLNEYYSFINNSIKRIVDGKLYLFGHSFGGAVSINIAYMKEENLKGLILCNSSGVRVKSRKLEVLGFVSNLVKPLFKLPGLKTVRRWIYYYILNSRDYINSENKKELLKNVLEDDLSGILEDIKVSTLLLWGDRDKDTPLWMGELMNKNIPNSELKIYEGEGHGLPKLKPEKIVGDIIEFIISNA